jgi:hypothetical protein
MDASETVKEDEVDRKLQATLVPLTKQGCDTVKSAGKVTVNVFAEIADEVRMRTPSWLLADTSELVEVILMIRWDCDSASNSANANIILL